jgi:hypothetical protein
MANGTAFNNGTSPGTKVINGCAEATDAPHRPSAASSSLVKAPLECSTTRFDH